MFKKFSKIFEAGGNVYQKGTPFSNGHRSRKNKDGFLLGRHLMIDIDMLVVDKNDKIVGIIEEKNQLPRPGSAFENILDPGVSNYQKLALLELTKRLSCKLFVYVKTDKKYHLLNQDFTTKEFTEEIMSKSLTDKSLRIIDTRDLIFVEFRNNYGKIVIKALAERVPSNNILYKYLNQISEAFGGIMTFQVDDTAEDIVFRVKGKFIGKVKSVLFPKDVDDLLRFKLEQEWEKIYSDLGIWN